MYANALMKINYQWGSLEGGRCYIGPSGGLYKAMGQNVCDVSC